MVEVWKQVVGWEGLYEVSDLGGVRRVAPGHGTHVGRVLRPWINPVGYPSVNLCKDGRRRTHLVHALVCRAFHGRRTRYRSENGRVRWQETRHKNGEKTNTRADNLMWGTSAMNQADKVRHGTHSRGERHGRTKLTEAQVRAIRVDQRTPRVMARDYGVTQSSVWQIRQRRSWAWLPEVRVRRRGGSYNGA